MEGGRNPLPGRGLSGNRASEKSQESGLMYLDTNDFSFADVAGVAHAHILTDVRSARRSSKW